MARPNPLRNLPSVDALLREPSLVAGAEGLPRALVVESIRAELAECRESLGAGHQRGAVPSAATIASRAARRARAEFRPQLTRVLNATGVVLHTNLGRSPFSEAARRAVEDVARGYSSLEYDLTNGRRGQRGAGVERWLTRLTGAEAALVANNGAAAILLVLTSLARGRKVLVSRGELVEIGGSFRIPDVLERSGATLVEVGTTNRTHLADYARALERHDDVAAILRVHRSNFRIEGFTTRPSLHELSGLARRHKTLLIEDLGSGALVDLAPLGLEAEPTVRESLTAGCDVVTFSGDKLLGSSQAGLVLGRKRWLDRVRRDPLARAFRVDKLTLAALEATLPAYLDPAQAVREIPALRMLHSSPDELEQRARRLAVALERAIPGIETAVVRGNGEVGGGALPRTRLPGFVVTIADSGRTAHEVEVLARAAVPPVIGTIREGRFRLDVRTLTDPEAGEAALALARALTTRPGSEGE